MNLEEFLADLKVFVEAELAKIPAPVPDPEPVPDPVPEPTPDPVPEPEPEPTPDPVPEPTPDPVPEPTPDPVPEPVAYSPPPIGADGLANSFTALGHKWSERNGMAWNTACPYAVGIAGDRLRFELHDTPNDRGPNDPDHKRRCEIGTNVAWPNTGFWFAYSVKTQIIGGDITDLGNTQNQFQSTDGSSPAYANRMQYDSGSPSKVSLVQTARPTGGSSKEVGKGVYTLDEWHDVVNYIDFAAGVAKTWLDGELITDFKGTFGGSDGLRLGIYGAPLGGMKIVQEYANVSAFPSAADLSGRVSNPPKMPS